jgi:endonuclease V-like protein UPF0215 family
VLPRPPKTLRVIGFDDAPFARARGSLVPIVGVVCAGTRFEGMVRGSVRRDGWTATDEIVRLLDGGKFLPQLHLVLLDGIAFGGLAIVDLADLAQRLRRPCVAVMRRAPNLVAMERAIRKLPDAERRLARLRRAGTLHHHAPFVFQVAFPGEGDAAEIGPALAHLTDRGHVPEALRLAHLVGSAWIKGESGNSA